jgi:1-acyl-sn-glycerol-3-phosphate acyltransferase
MLRQRMPTQRKSLVLSLASVYETLAISWPTVVDAALGRVERDVCDARLASWCQKVVHHARMDVAVSGREHMAPGATYLVMSNHQSHYDVPVLFYVLGANLRMITKVELFRIPIFGEAIRQAGFIAIDRSNRTRAIESLRIAKEKLSSGVHVWIAPEGTRSRSGELLPFKKGGFNLALEAKWPILPVSISGTREALRAKGMRTAPGAKISVKISPPIDAGDFAGHAEDGRTFKARREALMTEVRKAIGSGL